MRTYHGGAIRRQFRYDPQRAMLTARTPRDILLRYPLHERFRSFDRQWRRRGDLKHLPGLGQTFAFVSRRQQPIVANPLKARRQYMLQETADEHSSGNPDHPFPSGVVGAYAQEHIAIPDRDNAFIGNSGAMGIAGQVPVIHPSYSCFSQRNPNHRDNRMRSRS
jgi:hypothetical protein